MTAEAKQLEAKTPANETLSMIYDKAAGGYPIVNYEYAIIPAEGAATTRWPRPCGRSCTGPSTPRTGAPTAS